MANKNLKLKEYDISSIFSSKGNCYLLPFLSIFVCYIVSIIRRGKPEPGGYYLIHYLYNYDHGYIPRGLLGEVLGWFFDTVSDKLISEVSNLFSIKFFTSGSRLFFLLEP